MPRVVKIPKADVREVKSLRIKDEQAPTDLTTPAPTLPAVTMQARFVVNMRREVARAEGRMKDVRAAFALEHKDQIDRLAEMKTICADAEWQLRQMALDTYAKTGHKEAMPGVGVRILHKLEYDYDTAKIWARDHDIALLLDTKEFEKIARAKELAFVHQVEEPQAVLASNLTDLLLEVEGPLAAEQARERGIAGSLPAPTRPPSGTRASRKKG